MKDLPPLRSGDQYILSDAWNMHEQYKDPGKGFEPARLLLAGIETHDFTDVSVQRLHGEAALMCVELAGLAARQAKSEWTAIHYLTEAMIVIRNHFPIATDPVEAMHRNEYWEGIYGPDLDTQVKCARAIIKILTQVYGMTRDERILFLVTQIKGMIDAVPLEQRGRYALIVSIETGSLSEAIRAFANYRMDYAQQVQKFNPTEVHQVTKKFLSRFLPHPSHMRTHTKQAYDTLPEELKFSPTLLKEITAFAYIGLGKGKVLEINPMARD